MPNQQLAKLKDHGQRFWLDSLSRDMLDNGQLAARIRACDLLLPVYEASDGRDGFVSLDVSPHLAYDPLATLRQARALWDRVGRPNLFIKVPGTPQGLQAVETLLIATCTIFACATRKAAAWSSTAASGYWS
ncbi:Transaldolase [Thiorhodovibrio winogradskyi]|uniref:Transaldolase n=1 Tax=Thiorhodovibrio winogradskyi TaxID=77007 RepID=A0ABZ0SEE2_9GAMM|nr:transaldolase family protein [Thiorhodovibrio winogradskyi]